MDEKQIVKKLIEIYESFLKKGLTPDIQRKAERLYAMYLTAGPILDKTVAEALNYLSALTNWGIRLSEQTGLERMNKSKIKKLLIRLKNIKEKWK